MRKLIRNPAVIITVDTKGRNYKRGRDLNKLYPLEEHSVVIENGKIADLIPNSTAAKKTFEEVIDASGQTILPGLIDCHTHTLYAGSRSDEFKMRLAGEDYEEIAKSGGGILSTVKAVREASIPQLVKLLKPRVNHFISQGITTLEIKSGYGLSFYDEMKMLQAIQQFSKKCKIDIIPTFLGAHTFPPEYRNDHKAYLDIIVNQMIPFIVKNNLATTCDAFCEETAFNVEEIDRIFAAAKKQKLKMKLHTDQFNDIGGIDLALKYKALSVDHLEVASEKIIGELAKSKTAVVLLPGVSFFLDYEYAPARNLIDANAIIALATDFNPGSSHISNLHFIMSLAAIKMNMKIEETISAVTINAAKALGIAKTTGSIEIGKSADLAIFDTDNYSDILYNIGDNLTAATIKAGEVIYKKRR